MARGRGRGRGRDRGRVAREPDEPEVDVNPIHEGVAEGVGVAGDAAEVGGDGPQDEAQQQPGLNQMGQMMGLLAQILERLPGNVLTPAPVARPKIVEPLRAVNPKDRGDVVGPVIPPYLTVLDHMQGLDTKFFPGGAKLVEADEWKSRLERNFLLLRCPEEYKIDLAVHYLE